MQKGLISVISMLLVLVMLVNMLPVSAFAATTDTVSESTSASQDAPEDAYVVAELSEKRTEYTKEFRLSNGLHMAAVYAEPVHYEKNGEWVDIDNTLKTSGTGADAMLTNTAGVWEVRFPQQLSDSKAVTITKDGYTLSFFMSGELRNSSGNIQIAAAETSELETYAIGGETFTVQKSNDTSAQFQKIDLTGTKEAAQFPEMVSEKNYSRLQYTGVYENTNVVYDLASNRLKESIVINSYGAELQGYKYTLNVGSLIPVLTEENQILLYDKNKENVVMVMPAPYLVDDAGEYCNDVSVALVGKGDTYILTYTLPQSWMADETRAYPVILDPVVSAAANYSNMEDASVYSKGSDYTYMRSLLDIGYKTNYGIMRAFTKYVDLPKLKSSDIVISASFSLYKAVTSTDPKEVQLHKVKETWDSSTVEWDNQPEINTTIEDFGTIQAAGYYTYDITDIVRGWYEGENTGLAICVPQEIEETSTSNYVVQFYSSDSDIYNPDIKPILGITFRNNNGLESYWDYTASSAGRAGTGYVNNYTGNLTWIRNDIGFGGNRMPVSISHVYNANDSATDTFGMGYGWRTNFNQRVYRWDSEYAYGDYYVWEDSDGTAHYFGYDADKKAYLDEDGLELTLTTTGSGNSKYCITDKYGNKSYFDTYGRLRKQVNNQATTSNITVTYTTTSGNLISTITDGAGRVYSFTYSSKLLNRISFKGKGSTELSYVAFGYSSSNLSTVTDKDGKACTYTYNSNHLLTSGKDIDGYKLTYTYNTAQETWQPHRVASISESDSAAGGTLAIEYAHNQTKFTDHNGNVQIMQFNNLGNTVSVQDGLGRAQYAQYAVNDPVNTAGNGKSNQLTLSSKLQNSVGSILRDGSFEVGTQWYKVSSDVTQYSGTGPAYMGNKSIRITRSAAGSASGVNSGSINIGAGVTLTFSAYIKTTNGATAYLEMTDGTTSITSETLPANSDWTRLEVSFTNTDTTVKKIKAQVLTTTAGAVYMDCAQIERSPSASRYNLIANGDFGYTGTPAFGWTGTGLGTADTRTTTAASAAPELSTSAFSITGDPDTVKTLSQKVDIAGAAGDTFVLSGWAKGDSAPLSESRTFGLTATINYTDGSTDDFSVSFNPDADSSVSWQYAAAPLVAKKDYTAIDVSITYSHNVNKALFDGIQLYREAFGSSYTYDDEGNVISVVDLQKQTTTYEYNANNDLTGVNLPTGAKLTYTYDNYHNVKTATTEEGVVYNFTYDAYGNNTGVSIGSGTSRISSTAAYTSDGNRVASTTDASGKVTRYSYNENTNVLEWVQYPEDTEATRTNYTYDSMYRLASAAATTDTGSALTASYTYTDDMLTKITTGSTTYTFAYGDFALISSIKVGSKTLASYTYTSDQNKYLSKLAYGNGDSVQYTYDKYGRVTKQTYEDGSTVTFKYDNSGALATVTDSATGRTTTYYYDLTDRLMKYVESGSGYSHSVGYTYDEINNLTALVESINGTVRTTAYSYDEDNRVKSVTNGSAVRSYTYDSYGRISGQVSRHGGGTVLTEAYTYRSPSDTSTSGQVSGKSFTAPGFSRTDSYTYDDNGNIVSVTDGTHTATYVYDTANQLIRENNQAAGKTWVWSYDDAGNLQSREEYAYTTGTLGAVLDTVTYTYGNSDWGDLLTAYDGQTITYDGIGNPLTDGTWTYTWQNGRELAAMSGESGVSVSHKYDANGMRAEKTVVTEVCHTHIYIGVVTVPTCIEGGYTTYTCECGDSYQANTTAATGHSYTAAVTEASCTEDGIAVYTCPCGHSYQETITATGHSYSSVITAPTCTENGCTTHTCACGDTYQDSVTDALGHDYVESQGDGVVTYTCSRCADSYSEHVHTYAATSITVNPTCTSAGYTVYACGCGHRYDSDVIAALGHDYAQTTLSDGVLLVCSRCGDSYTEGHTHDYLPVDIVEPTCTEGGYSVYMCECRDSYRAEETAALGHNYVQLICTRCGKRPGSGDEYPSPTPVPPPNVGTMSTDAAQAQNSIEGNSAEAPVTVTGETILVETVTATYRYVYNGGSLSRMTVSATRVAEDTSTTETQTLYFAYDADGVPMAVDWDGTTYYYVTNLQGDVIAILNSGGTAVVTYTYDAWGNILSTTGTMASTLGTVNPLRYRGYVYDNDSGLYYLQSRYYDPELGRFLNADSYASTGQGILGCNMFAYCNNSPTNRGDSTGTCSYDRATGKRRDCGRSNCPDSSSYIPYTVSLGGILSFGIGPLSLSLQIGLVTDATGASEIQVSYSAPNIFSSGLPSTDEMLADIAADKPKFKVGMSIAGTVTVTNAPSISNLYGPTYSVGGATTGLAVDYNAIPVGDGSNAAYSGITVASGMITPGFNYSMSNTVWGMSVPFSVFDIIEAMYNGVYGR